MTQNNKLQKDTLTDTLTALIAPLVMGIFGAFFRWMQLLNGFEKTTNLAIPKAGSTLCLTGVLVVAACVFAFLSLRTQRRYSLPKDAAHAFALPLPMLDLVFRICGAGTAIVSALLLMEVTSTRFTTLHMIQDIAGIVAGISLFLIPGFGNHEDLSHGAGGLSLPCLSVFAGVSLIVCYKDNCEDPVTWHYVIEILAISGVALSWYALSAYHYENKARPAITLFYLMSTVCLLIINIADGKGPLYTGLIVCQILPLLCYILLLANSATSTTQVSAGTAQPNPV